MGGAGRGRPLTRRGALLLAAGGLAQLSLPPAEPRPPAPATGAPGPASAAGPELERLLARRAGAVLGGDRTALLADVDPRARIFRRDQADLLARLAAVPLAGWRYRLLGQRVGWADGAAGERLAARAELRYAVAGYDRHPAAAARRLLFTRRDGRWLLSSDTGAPGTGRTAAPGAPVRRGDVLLWDLGTVRAAAGRDCLVLGLADRAELGELAAVAERAVPAVSAVWGGHWAGRLLVEAPRTLDQLGALLQADPAAYRDIAAVTASAPGAPAAAADRVLVNPDAYRQLSPFGRQVVITHETVHVATRAWTRPWTPLWLSEGAADWTAYLGSGRTPRQIAPELARDLRAGRGPHRLPADGDFAPTAGGLPQAYEMAWLACDTVARRWGRGALVALYREVAAAGERTGPGDAVERAMRAVLGTGRAAFTRLWLADTEARLG